MGVGYYECGLDSGYNMYSEEIQDHAVVNAQNMAVTVGLAMPWAGNSSDYECSFSMGVSLSKLWLLYSQSHLVEFFDFQSFKCSSLVSYDAFQKNPCLFSLHLYSTFLDSGQKHNIAVYSSASGGRVTNILIQSTFKQFLLYCQTMAFQVYEL